MAMGAADITSVNEDSAPSGKPLPKIRLFPIVENPPNIYECGYQDGPPNAARFCNPTHLTTDGKNLYVADTSNHVIRKIVLSTGRVTTLAGYGGQFGSVDETGSGARFRSPRGMTLDKKRDTLYITDTGNHTIRKIVISNASVSTVAGTSERFGSNDGPGLSARFNEPQGITGDPSGTSLYIADTSNHTIRKIEAATGMVTTIAGRPGFLGFEDGKGTASRFDHPTDIAVDPSGAYLYVADASNQAVRKIVIATGEVTTLLGKRGEKRAGGRLGIPHGITLDPSGANIYVADTANHSIRKIDASTGETSNFTGTPGSPLFGFPQGIVFPDEENTLLISDKLSNSIQKWAIATGKVTTLAGPPGFPKNK